MKDSVYAKKMHVDEFVFDDRVASVFSDMINRSVPGYATIISMIGILAERYCQPGSRVYDLGCSLGAAAISMRQHIGHGDYELIAVDKSEAMISRLSKAELSGGPEIQLHCADILEVNIDNASVVVLNFTLQFIAPDQRLKLIRKVCEGLNPGGILILSEKIEFPDPVLNDLFIDMYHQFKEVQGYSQLEISQKRTALENVLIPESIETHKTRLRTAGFKSCDVWFQCFNFASLVAFK